MATAASSYGPSTFAPSYSSSLASAGADYGGILKAYQDRQSAIAGNLDALGKNQIQDANDYYANQGKSYDQSAVARGLGNTTIRGNMQAGNNYQRDRAVGQINNSINAQKIGLQSQLSGDTLGYAERGGNFGAEYGLNAGRLDLSRQQLAQQGSQFGQSLAQNANQFGQNLDFQKYQFANRVLPGHYGAGTVSPPGHSGAAPGSSFGGAGTLGYANPHNSYGSYHPTNAGNYNVPQAGQFVPQQGAIGPTTTNIPYFPEGTNTGEPPMYDPNQFADQEFGTAGIDWSL